MIDNKDLIPKTKELIIKLNEKLFDNKLTIDFEIKASATTKSAGMVCFSKLDEVYKVDSLKISKNFDWTESDLIKVISHELIHVYEVQILKRKAGHGVLFLAKMRELNSRFPEINIPLKHKMTSNKVKAPKMIPFLLSENKEKIVFMTDALANNLPSRERLVNSFGNYKLGTISSDKITGYRIFRQLVRSYIITNDVLKRFGLDN